MTLLKDVKDALDFLKRERLWTLLLIFLTLAFIFLLTPRPGKLPHKKEQPSAALQKLQMAENKLKEEIKEKGGFQNFLADRPGLQKIFSLFTVLMAAVFLLGLGIDFLWVSRPSWRNRLQAATGPPEALTWNLGTIFKTILLFVLASLSLSFVLSLLKAVFFRGASPNLFILLHTTASDLLCIAFVVGFICRAGGSWKDLGFRGIQFWKDFGVGLMGYAAILPLFFLLLLALVFLVQLLAYEPTPHPLVEVFLEEERSPLLIGYSLFLACVVGPIFEEIFFRGFCYPAFKKRWAS